MTEVKEVKTLDQINAMSVVDQLAYFGPPAAGRRYLKKKETGRLQIGADMKPIDAQKKTGGSRNKPKKPQYTVPVGKLRTAETPQFDVLVHARLKSLDFSDPLDYARWNVWYYERMLEVARTQEVNIAASGATADERTRNKDLNRQVSVMESLVAKIQATGSSAVKNALQERLGKLFAAASIG